VVSLLELVPVSSMLGTANEADALGDKLLLGLLEPDRDAETETDVDDVVLGVVDAGTVLLEEDDAATERVRDIVISPALPLVERVGVNDTDSVRVEVVVKDAVLVVRESCITNTAGSSGSEYPSGSVTATVATTMASGAPRRAPTFTANTRRPGDTTLPASTSVLTLYGAENTSNDRGAVPITNVVAAASTAVMHAASVVLLSVPGTPMRQSSVMVTTPTPA
jgi:hypothetical protein